MEQQVSRKERERLARKQIMLEAARYVIAEKGFKRATLDEIAQRAEFGKGTIYNYFPQGKDQMLFDILDDVYDDLYAISVETFASVPDVPFRERLLAYVEKFLTYFTQQRDLFVILMKEANRIALGDDEAKAIFFKGHLDRLVGVIEPAVKAAIASGELRPFASESIAHMILGNVHGYLRYSSFRGIGNGTEEDCALPGPCEAAQFLCGILLDGLAVTPKVASDALQEEAGGEAL